MTTHARAGTSQWIHEILPQPVYQIISDSWHYTLQYSYTLRTNADPSTLYAIKLGLTLGLVLTTLLAFFPGKPFSIKTKTSDVAQESFSSDSEQKDEWAGDEIPKQKLEVARKKLGLSKEQMDQAVEQTRAYALNKSNNTSDIDPYLEDGIIHGKTWLNGLVYVCLFSFGVYYLNREYNNLATIWFIRLFPKEAETLGITNWMIRLKQS